MSARTPKPGEERVMALAAFWTDLHRSRLSSGPARLVPLGLAVGVAVIAVLVGDAAAVTAAAAIAVLFALALWRLDGPRWHGQDVVYWLHALRARRWVADTGGPSPVEQPGRAETWLALHPRGSVPQLYRAIVASQSGDTVLAERELAALEVETPLDRARRAWLPAAIAVNRGEQPDLVPLRALVADLPAGPDHGELDAFLGCRWTG